MHKLFLTALALLLVFSFAGCVKAPPASNEDSTTQASTQATTAEALETTQETTEEQTTFGELHFPETE